MRILWHMPALHEFGDGLSQRAYALAAELARRGHSIAFCAAADRVFVSGSTVYGFPIDRLPPMPDSRPVHWSLQALSRRRAARRLVAGFARSHDVFITCQAEVLTAYKSIRTGVPVIFVSGSSTLLFDGADRADQRCEPALRRLCYAIDRRLKHRNEIAAYRNADRVVFDSGHTRELVKREYRLRGENLRTILGGVDPIEFAPPTAEQRMAARARLGFPDEAVVVMGSGRLVKRKGFALLVSALAQLRRPMAGLIVGDGPERGALQSLADVNTDVTIAFTGMTADVRTYLHAADIYAFTSICESFGAALVEAMACGLPCIGVRPDGRHIVNANAEILEDGVSGVLCRNDVGSLVAAISRLAADASMRRRLGLAARQRVCERFTWNRAGVAMGALIDSINTSEAMPSAGLALQG